MSPSRDWLRNWELRDLALLVGLAVVAALSSLVWLTGQLAGGLFGGGRPGGGLPTSARALVRLPGHLRDPREAWPTPDRVVLPDAVGWYIALLVVLVLAAVVVGLPLWLLRDRLRDLRAGPTDPPTGAATFSGGLRPRWSEGFARRSDLSSFYIDEPAPGRVSLGYSYGRLSAAQLEQSVLVVGPTRSGKTTGFAIPNLLEWRGPAVVLSAKTDLVHVTHAARAQRGPVSVFDPTGVSGFATAGWSPITEASTWSGAVRISNAMSRLSGTTDGLGGSNHWQRVAAQLLAPLPHAAALDERYSMSDVLSWVKTHRVGPAMAALVRSENHVAAESLQSTLDTEQRQRDSAFNTVRTVIDAYEDPDVLASAVEETDRPLLDETGTLYLVATASDQARLSPLFLGLLDQLLRDAFLRAAESRVKLGEPVAEDRYRLLLLLDEAANIAPLPDLATLASTAGGEGVQLLTIFQDLSQLRHRYGDEWGSIASNHTTKVLLPGVGDPETLQYFSHLTGETEVLERSQTRGEGRTSITEVPRRRPLLDAAGLRALPGGTGLAWTGTVPAARFRLRRPEEGSETFLASRGQRFTRTRERGVRCASGTHLVH